jgi:hypothetical protein
MRRPFQYPGTGPYLVAVTARDAGDDDERDVSSAPCTGLRIARLCAGARTFRSVTDRRADRRPAARRR